MKEIHVEEALATLNIVIEEGITYYDASYICAAIKNNTILVTDDEKLHIIAKKYVEAITSEGLNRSEIITDMKSRNE